MVQFDGDTGTGTVEAIVLVVVELSPDTLLKNAGARNCEKPLAMADERPRTDPTPTPAAAATCWAWVCASASNAVSEHETGCEEEAPSTVNIRLRPIFCF